MTYNAVTEAMDEDATRAFDRSLVAPLDGRARPVDRGVGKLMAVMQMGPGRS